MALAKKTAANGKLVGDSHRVLDHQMARRIGQGPPAVRMAVRELDDMLDDAEELEMSLQTLLMADTAPPKMATVVTAIARAAAAIEDAREALESKR